MTNFNKCVFTRLVGDGEHVEVAGRGAEQLVDGRSSSHTITKLRNGNINRKSFKIWSEIIGTAGVHHKRQES